MVCFTQKEELEVLGVIKKKKKVTASYDVTRARNDESDTETQPHDTNYTRNGRGLWKRLTGVAVTKEEDLPDDMVDHDHAVLIRSVEKREIKSEEEDELEKEEERKENIESCTEAKVWDNTLLWYMLFLPERAAQAGST